MASKNIPRLIDAAKAIRVRNIAGDELDPSTYKPVVTINGNLDEVGKTYAKKAGVDVRDNRDAASSYLVPGLAGLYASSMANDVRLEDAYSIENREINHNANDMAGFGKIGQRKSRSDSDNAYDRASFDNFGSRSSRRDFIKKLAVPAGIAAITLLEKDAHAQQTATVTISGNGTYYDFAPTITLDKYDIQLPEAILMIPRFSDPQSLFTYIGNNGMADPEDPLRDWQASTKPMEGIDFLRYMNANNAYCGPHQVTLFEKYPLLVYLDAANAPAGYAQFARDAMADWNNLNTSMLNSVNFATPEGKNVMAGIINKWNAQGKKFFVETASDPVNEDSSIKFKYCLCTNSFTFDNLDNCNVMDHGVLSMLNKYPNDPLERIIASHELGHAVLAYASHSPSQTHIMKDKGVRPDNVSPYEKISAILLKEIGIGGSIDGLK